MRRREFIALVGGAAAWPIAARAQLPGKVYRVGLILTASPVAEMAGLDPVHPHVRAFVHKLRDLGYVEGRNLILERRSAEGTFERFGEILAEVVQLKPDVIVTVSDVMTQEAKRATQTVPIVMAVSFDPVGTGNVASLARPGSNVTGVTLQVGPEIATKRLQLLKELVPEMSRIAYLATANEWKGKDGEAIRHAANAMNVSAVHAQFTPGQYANAFAVVTREQPRAVLMSASPAHFAHRRVVIDFTAEHRIAAIYATRQAVEDGGLMSYGVDVAQIYRRAASYVDRILKGAKPAELPVEQPTKFELVINLKTAKTLGLTMPPSLLAQADEVIE